MAIIGDVFGPAVAALTLGLLPAARLARQMGRNAAFDHAGNIFVVEYVEIGRVTKLRKLV